MNCKNCQTPLSNENKFCPACGGKVVEGRFSIKMLMQDASKEIFGWDNKLFITVKHLVLKPEVLLKEYLGGTRRKYMNPLAFLTIGAAVSVLFFNVFSKEYIAYSSSFQQSSSREVGESVGRGLAKVIKGEKQDKIAQLDSLGMDSLLSVKPEAKADSSASATPFRDSMNTKVQETILKYYNLVTYLMIPFYALLAFWVFGKPYNYAEHLVITCFLQGFTFLTGTLSFLSSVFISPHFMSLGIVIASLYYSYAYARLYEHNFKQVILKFLKFLLILAAMLVGILLLGTLIGVLVVSLGYELPR